MNDPYRQPSPRPPEPKPQGIQPMTGDALDRAGEYWATPRLPDENDDEYRARITRVITR